MHPFITVRRSTGSVAAVLAVLAVSAAPALAQSINVDIDFPGELPALGGGVPASVFGGAAGQPGVWNSMRLTSGPISLVNLSGGSTSATLSVPFSSDSLSLLAFNNPANTGNFALLFNDASQIGTILQGGTRTYQFNGLINGSYAVYTYGTPPSGTAGELFINVPGSSQGTLMTSGAMTGDTFTLGVTHVIHTLNVTSGTISINMTDTPGGDPAFVNGFQLVLIPAPATWCTLLAAPLLSRRRRSLRK